MSRDKQISDMQNLLWCRVKFLDSDESVQIAEALYNAGYRKSTEVAEEIFAEIDEARERWEAIYSPDHFGYGGGAYGYLETDVDHTIAELKKKYTEEGK